MSISANPAPTAEPTTQCPYCAEVIAAEAKKCKHCGEFLDPTLRQERTAPQVPQQKAWNPGTAAVLSFVIPGTGQMYKGRILAGLVWLVGVGIGYVAFVVPGVILHIACVYNAYSYDPNKRDEPKPVGSQPARTPYDPQKSVLFKVGRAWRRMASGATSRAATQPSVFCSCCRKYTSSKTASCNRCGKPLT
jgi:TM2 domain-containing membrane protein YozV